VHSLALCLVLVAAALPEARVHVDEDRPEEALRAASQALEDGGLPRARVAEAWVLKGRAFALLGEAEQAERMFGTALRVSRKVKLGSEDPLFTEPFEAARAALPDASDALDVQVVVTEAAGRRTLELRVPADDQGLVAGARVLLDGDKLADLEVTRAERATYPVAPERVNGMLSVVFVDAFGNELRTVELEGASGPPAGAPGDEADGAFASDGGLRWLSLGGATTMAVGVVGMAAAGMWLAAYDAGDVTGADGTREVAMVGVGIGVGVVAIGGALVVTDFLLDPPGG
jgi:hypothetical protein